jgi:hypothetical protein
MAVDQNVGVWPLYVASKALFLVGEKKLWSFSKKK